MPTPDFSGLLSALETQLKQIRLPSFEDVVKAVEGKLEDLYQKDLVALSPDHQLGGRALEMRIAKLFQDIGFDIQKGPESLHDFVIIATADLQPAIPIVLEVKSSKSPELSRSDLRQLDDWVFELSNEEQARKHGLGGGPDTLAIATVGMITTKHTHPTPHKGLMIFNGSQGQPFSQRSESWVGGNEQAFANKRNFCLISFESFLKWAATIQTGQTKSADFWKAMHATAGILRDP